MRPGCSLTDQPHSRPMFFFCWVALVVGADVVFDAVVVVVVGIVGVAYYGGT